MIVAGQTKYRFGVAGVALLLMSAMLAMPVRADLVTHNLSDSYHYTYGFTTITNRKPDTDVKTGEAQLSVVVSANAPTDPWARFTFYNTGPAQSAITGIFFERGMFSPPEFPVLIGGPYGTEVRFHWTEQEKVLPGWDTLSPPFETHWAVTYVADEDPASTGIGPGQWLEVLFRDLDGRTFEDVIAAVNQGFIDPQPGTRDSLRVAVHVTGFYCGGDESFLMVPVPGATLLGLLGLGTAAMKLRRRCV